VRGEPLGLLHGVPVSVKDTLWTAGVRTTMGSAIYDDFVPTQDAAIVARLKAAGAILLGKTTTPEFAHKGLTDSPLLGVTRNPWSTAHTCGRPGAQRWGMRCSIRRYGSSLRRRYSGFPN
jgi:aspartyl-tRNA(Asn)/glutamyl-tRNA(Gln) amidotransferase subunit A